MRICVLTHTFPRYRGDPVAPFMEDFCRGLVEAGNEVFLLAPYDRSFSLEGRQKNFKIKLYRYIIPERFHVLGYSRTMVGDQRLKFRVYLLAPFMFLTSFFSLLSLVRSRSIDIISAHWILPNGFVAALVSKITGVPLVITVPGSDIYMAKKNFAFRLMTAFAAQQAKIVVSNSSQYLKIFSKLGIKLRKSKEILYGIDVKKYRQVTSQRQKMRRLLGFAKNDLVILACGRLVEKKGFEYLIKALPIVLKKEKQAKLAIIGDGTEKERLQKMAKDLKVKTRVVFLGTVGYNRLSSYYSLADVYVDSSIKDSQGNLQSQVVSLLVAIASGLPIVATRLAVSAKYVVDGKNGYRVKEKDAESLALGILSIAGSSDRAKMSKENRLIAEKYLSYRNSGEEYTKIFSQLP